MPKTKTKKKKQARSPYPWVNTSQGTCPIAVDSTEIPSYSVPLRTVQDDEEVLRTARPDETPCSNGDTCVAVSDIPGGPGLPCVSLGPSTQCLLCLRREARTQYVQTTSLGFSVPHDRIFQRWRSPVGTGGYAEAVCIGTDPMARRYTGFILPCAVGLVDHFTWFCTPEGEWKIDQSPLYHSHFRQAPRENTEPRLGGASSDS